MTLFRKIVNKLKRSKPVEKLPGQRTYSQSGEDAIVRYIFNSRKTVMKNFLDLGAYHPTYLSNTYAFYEQGIHGVCVEPNATNAKNISAKRPLDKVVNAGVTYQSSGNADYYVFESDVLNTFSKDEADRMINENGEILKEVIKLPVININELIAKVLPEGPDFVSLDIEGLDYDIVKNYDFERSRPKVWCIETLEYSMVGKNNKDKRVEAELHKHNYMLYADTFINTIFVDFNWWSMVSK